MKAIIAGAWFVELASSLAAQDPRTPVMRYQLDGPQENCSFAEVAFVGDLDHDGCADFVVGADRYDDSGMTKCGAAFLYSGRTGQPLMDGSTPVVLKGDFTGATFGKIIRPIADLDGDGIDEVVIAAPSYQNTNPLDGVSQYVRVFSGGALTSTQRSCRIPVPRAQGTDGNFGTDLADAGNAFKSSFTDTRHDLLVGTGGGYNTAYLWSGADIARHLTAGTDVTEAPKYTVPSTDIERDAEVDGVAVAGFRDVDGDGADEFLIGDYAHAEGSHPNIGKVFLKSGDVVGGASTLGVTLDEQLGDDVPGSQPAFGYALQPLAIDFDGAGGAPAEMVVAIGAPAGDKGRTYAAPAGQATILRAIPSGGSYVLSEIAEVTGATDELFGAFLAGGDIDGDTMPDLVVAARYASTGTLTSNGRVVGYRCTVSSGALSLAAFSPAFEIAGKASEDKLGRLSLDGDATLDGTADLLIATGHVNINVDGDPELESNVGRAYLVSSNVIAAQSDFGGPGNEGARGVPVLTVAPNPIFGETINVTLTNTTEHPATHDYLATIGLVWAGADRLSSARDDYFWIDLTRPCSSHWLFFAAGDSSKSFASDIECDPALIGFHYYLQGMVADDAADPNVAVSLPKDVTLGIEGTAW